jgi:hypothetical protein
MAMGVRVTIYAGQAIAEARKLSTPERAEIAEEIAADARADAPVLTGQFRDGIHAEISGDDVRVVDDDPTAGYKEYGTSTHAAKATLTNAARKHGKYTGMTPRGRR